jgi:PHS family inorganic phosphate transporter-like MFS transporter
VFSRRFRSTAHGFCAAAGKAGAIIGVFGFGFLKDTPSPNAGLQVRCAAVAVLQ